MNSLFEIMNLPANTIFDQANELVTALPGIGLFPAAGSGLAFALLFGAKGSGNIPMREEERHRQEIEQLKNELNAKK
jgi:hypothetical protein